MTSETWDARYREADRAGATVWSAAPNEFVVAELADLPPGRGVDLGAGEGRNALWLASRGWTMTAVDFSAVAIETGERVAAERGIGLTWVVADVTQWESPAPVDLVVVAYLHLPGPDLRAIASRVGGWLVDGGTLLVVGHDVENLATGAGGPRNPDTLYHDRMDFPGLTVVRNDLVPRQTTDGATALDRLVRAVRRPWLTSR